MLNVVRAAAVLILVQSIHSTDPNDFLNRKYYSSSVLGLVKLLKMEQEFMVNFSIYTNILQEKVDNLNMWVELSPVITHSQHS